MFVEFIVLFIAMLATAYFFHVRFNTTLSVILFKTEEGMMSAVLGLVSMLIAVLFWAIYIIWF